MYNTIVYIICSISFTFIYRCNKVLYRSCYVKLNANLSDVAPGQQACCRHSIERHVPKKCHQDRFRDDVTVLHINSEPQHCEERERETETQREREREKEN